MAKVINRDETHKGFIDLDKNELRNAQIQNLASDPASPDEGQIWYRTDTDRLMVWANGAAEELATMDDVGAGAVVSVVAGNGVDVDDTDPANPIVAVDESELDAALLGNLNEAVADQVGTMVTGNTESGITVAYQDGDNTLDFTVTDSPLLGGQNSAFHLARGNHTGTQAASTISDFDTQVRTSRLDQMAAPTGSVSLNSQKITNLLTGTADSDGATVGQLNAVAQGLDYKNSVRAASTGNVTLASAVENGDTLDGVTLATGDRVLLKDQSSGAENGIYTVNASGAPTRAVDMDAASEVKGAVIGVEEGTANADTVWLNTNDGSITLGTTALTFIPFPGLGALTAGAGLTKTASTIDVGAGTGITVNANDVAIDTSVVARKATGTLSGGATSEVITHGLGTRGVVITIYQTSTPWAEEDFEIEHTSTTTATIRAAASIAGSTYSWVAIG